MNMYLICFCCFIVGSFIGFMNILVSIALIIAVYFGTKYYVNKFTRDLGGLGVWVFSLSSIIGMIFGSFINLVITFFAL